MTGQRKKEGVMHIDTIDGIIHVSYTGFLTERATKSIMEQLYEYSRAQHKKNLPTLALFDLRKLSGQSSGARSAIKTLQTGTLDNLAIVGGSISIRLAAQYLVRAGGIDTVTKFTHTKRQAVAWLLHKRMSPKSHNKASFIRPSIFVVPAILLLVLSLTTISWYQASQQVTHNVKSASEQELATIDRNLDGRMKLYVNILEGFKAFFESNDTVNRAQFNNYFSSLQLQQEYPGFSVFLYVKKVPASELKQFEKDARTDTSFPSNSKPNFKVTPVSSSPIYYPVLYSAQGSSKRDVEGIDLGQTASRLSLLEHAGQTGQLTASETIDLNGSQAATLGSRPGFFITLPVYVDASSRTPDDVVGYVSTTFEHKLILNGLTDDNGASSIHIYDNSTNTLVYQEDKSNVLKSQHATYTTDYELGGKKWRLELATPSGYGINEQENNLPIIIAVAGSAVALLLLMLYFAILRSRKRALVLAEEITKDLRKERNNAVSLREKDEAILSSIGDAVFAIDTKGNITLFNEVAAKLSGYSQEEAIGKPYTEILPFLHEDNGKQSNEFITKALGGKLSSMRNHTVLVRRDGSSVAVADSAAPIRDSSNVITGVIVVFRDVSKEQELDKAKTEFVSLASHQLRTPLSAINWYGELLLSGDAGKLTDDQLEYVREIFEGSQRMSELVNSFLDVSRLEVGKLVSKPEPTHLIDLINGLKRELEMAIDSKKIKMTMNISPIPEIVADPKQLGMIVQNLMSNAVKYTDNKGIIEITLREASKGDQETAGLKTTDPLWYFSVRDDGYGIPKQQQAKIFTKLFRADNVRRLDVEGTGLGLYIVKEVVNKLGGTVWFDSVEGQGTTFHVVAPFNAKHTK